MHPTPCSLQTFWVAWQTVLSFLIPVLTIFACWVVMIYLFLTQELNRSVTILHLISWTINIAKTYKNPVYYVEIHTIQ